MPFFAFMSEPMFQRCMRAVLALMLVCVAHAAGGNESGKVKVFILAGQSNMEGFGHVRTLPRLGEEPGNAPLLKRLRGDDGAWRVRDDVFVSFRSGKTVGPLGIGFGADADRLGPELMFGTIVGDAIDAPVVLIKTAWGGKDLHFDFRPPGAGKLPYPIDAKALSERGGPAAVGECYRRMVADVRDCLKNLGSHFPALAGRDHEIVGFVWFQGWNEMFPSQGCPFEQIMRDYPDLYATMIQDLEKEFGLKRLPSVVAEMGVNGAKAGGRSLDLRKAQAAIADHPALKGKVRFVRTAQHWDPKLDELQAREREIDKTQREKLKDRIAADLKGDLEGKPSEAQQKLINAALERAVRDTDEYKVWQTEWEKIASHWECHYFGSAAIYCLIGNDMATAMLEMIGSR